MGEAPKVLSDIGKFEQRYRIFSNSFPKLISPRLEH